jgi:hypothetical protein
VTERGVARNWKKKFSGINYSFSLKNNSEVQEESEQIICLMA